jgi:hypothetical protein
LFLILSVLVFSSCKFQIVQKPTSDQLFYNAPTQYSVATPETQEVIVTKPNEHTYYPYDAGFTGIEVEDIEHIYGNNTFTNLTFKEPNPHGFCYAEEIDTLFYVNYAHPGVNPDPYYLYAYKDGVSTLIIEEAVNYINYWNGDLYFLTNDNLTDLYTQGQYIHGKLFKYNLKTKEKEQLLDEYIWDLSICDGYLYFRNSVALGESRISEFYRMSLDSREPEMTNYRPFFYGDYQLQFDPHPSNPRMGALELTNGIETIQILNYGFYKIAFSEYCINKGVLWFQYTDAEAKQQFASMDLTNGEVTTYHFKWDENLNIPFLLTSFDNFTVLDGKLYVLFGGMMAIYDPQKEILVPIPEYTDNMILRYYNVLCEIYTDGTSLYAYDWNLQTVHKITPNDNGTYENELIQPQE